MWLNKKARGSSLAFCLKRKKQDRPCTAKDKCDFCYLGRLDDSGFTSVCPPIPVFYLSMYIYEKSKEFLDSSKAFDDPIVTQIVPAPEFYKAEDYHQKYFKKQGF